MCPRFQAFSWGFGGYGRLGHSETGNELVPRLIKFLDGPRRGIRSVVAGGKTFFFFYFNGLPQAPGSG
jgi:alpha-tubulin suppressor-like RCC1 family protein